MPLPDAERLCTVLADSMRPGLHPDTTLVGIHTGGVWVAERLHAALGLKTPLGCLDVSFYRDDFSRSGLHAQIKSSDMPFEVEDRPIVIVDDVLYTGRTIRAAMNEIFDYGRPARIDLSVLIDRGGRELPVCPRWTAQAMELGSDKNLQLERSEAGGLTLRLVDA
ncbi:MAG: bifunctional pyr operon transcriptional regulator/uracil phosphoribosyltransferase PyrR [Betaproteobacteria bacterium]|jgi:pyrimidine operon attenuation protein/uracil phosphoribosyltransferase|nr:bifunctional pyr operon transcriptional regulator/uracil phosphoribosyltransferase PyrR [Betaproteobacteria bacterium]